MSMSTSAAVLLGLAASACWALANVAVARGTRAVGGYRALLWAQVAGGIVAAPLALLLDQREPMSTWGASTVAWLIAVGPLSLLSYLCMFHALQHGRLSIVAPIMSGWAVISSTLSIVAFHEPMRAPQVAGAALVIAGVTLVSHNAHSEGRAAGGRSHWLLAAFGTAIGFGLAIPAVNRIAPATGRLGAVCVVYAACMLVGLPLAARFRISVAPPSGRAWVPVVLAGLFETGGFACLALTAGRAPLAVVSPLASLASAMTVVYAWVVQRERPSGPALAGAILASAGVVMLAL